MNNSSEGMSGNKPGRHWGVILFGLVFVGIGTAFLLLSVIPNLWDTLRMRDWVEVPAEVLAADLETSRSDGSTTYRATARFDYRFQGQQYTGDRVGIADGSADNVGTWQQATYARTRNAKQIRLWVNPDNPSESVYDRELRWEFLGFKMIFVVGFGGFGVLAVWLANRKPKPAPAGIPAWQAQPEWAENNIRSNARTTLWVAWGFALFWNAISSFMPFVLPQELERGNHLALVALVFPAIGLGLLVWAIRQTLNWRRFGTTLLQMDPFPGALGGDVGGTIELRLPYDSTVRFPVTLTCDHVYRRRTHKRTETVRDVQWQDEQLAQVQPGMYGTRLRFLFKTPEGLPETSLEEDARHEWTVHINADLQGTDFDRSWQVPVLRDAGPRTAREPIRPQALDINRAESADSTVQLRETGSGLECYYPYLRHPGTVFGTLFTGACFAGFAWFFRAAAEGDFMSDIFVWLFAVVGALIIAWGLYLAGNALRVTANPLGLQIERGVFGLRFSRQVAANEISGIEKSIGMQTRQGNRSRAYYSIQVRTRDGRSITAGSGISGASRVDALISRMGEALRLA